MRMSKRARPQFGYTVFNLTVEEQVELATAADELGYGAAWFGEHIVMPMGEPSIYMPKAATDPTAATSLPRSIYDAETRLYDLMVLLGAVAQATRRIAIITGVYLAPFRHPLITARSAATLDELTGGRFQLGLGAGWNREEFDALGGDFAHRGELLDETVAVLRAAMQGGAFEFHGSHYAFGPVQISRKPFRVPLLFGGHSAPALRRAAGVGDGWVSSISNDVDELVALRDKIDHLRAEMGRSDRPFAHWIKLNSTDPKAIARLQERGVDHIILYGDALWGAGEVRLNERLRRLREVAYDLGISQG
jgi:probable F420-dependent oxidoreductase